MFYRVCIWLCEQASAHTHFVWLTSFRFSNSCRLCALIKVSAEKILIICLAKINKILCAFIACCASIRPNTNHIDRQMYGSLFVEDLAFGLSNWKIFVTCFAALLFIISFILTIAQRQSDRLLNYGMRMNSFQNQ